MSSAVDAPLIPKVGSILKVKGHYLGDTNATAKVLKTGLKKTRIRVETTVMSYGKPWITNELLFWSYTKKMYVNNDMFSDCGFPVE